MLEVDNAAVKLGTGTLLGKVDIKNAYRMVPGHRKDTVSVEDDFR